MSDLASVRSGNDKFRLVNVDITNVSEGQGDLLSGGTAGTINKEGRGLALHGDGGAGVLTDLNHNVAGVLGAALVLVGDLDGGDGETVLHVDGDNLTLLGRRAVSITGVLARIGNVSGSLDGFLALADLVFLGLGDVVNTITGRVLHARLGGLGEGRVGCLANGVLQFVTGTGVPQAGSNGQVDLGEVNSGLSVHPGIVSLLPGDLLSSPQVVLLAGVVDRVTYGVPGTLVHGLVPGGVAGGSESNGTGGLVSLLVVPDSAVVGEVGSVVSSEHPALVS